MDDGLCRGVGALAATKSGVARRRLLEAVYAVHRVTRRDGVVGGVPEVPLCLSVGVTGHRDIVDADGVLRARLDLVLRQLAEAVTRLAGAGSSFPPGAPQLRLICPLAQGADQIAAAAALALGYDLHAVLPFRRDDYAADFAEPLSAAAFAALLERATRVLELPCRRDERPSAYTLAGRATVVHSDVLVAVWDGLPARGTGGTGEIVEQALRLGLPVIHVPIDPGCAIRLMWSAHEPQLIPTRLDEIAARPLDVAEYDPLIDRLLAPPSDAAERDHLAAFLAERERRFKPRIEYPLLLAATGSRRLSRSALFAPPYLAQWQATVADEGVAGQTDVWRGAFAWSDALATHFAQSYRSGHVFNFCAGALAVLLGLSGLLLPTVKLWLALAELGVVTAFIVNTRVGVARNWHRRWLDYRQLAERLRPMASLIAVGIAQPDRYPVSRRATSWVDWYAAGVWRSIGMPAGELTADVGALTRAIVAREIRPQVVYNRTSAAAVRHLDHRLHRAGTVLFAISCLSCVAFIVAYLIDHAWTVAHAADFVALSAGLPAIGTAFFGIRVQGDFAGTAARSEVTADHLSEIAAALEAGPMTLSRTADGIEAAARAMFVDLGEWRLSHQQRQLELA